MDFTQQNPQASGGKKKRDGLSTGPIWLRAVWIVLLFSATVVASGILSLLIFSNLSETKYVSSSKFQALYLNDDEVLIGKIKTINSHYVDLQDIFSTNNPNALKNLTSASKNVASSVALTLVKPDCNAYGSYDDMIISRGEVKYWQNLRPDSQVVQAINAREQNGTDATCGM